MFEDWWAAGAQAQFGPTGRGWDLIGLARWAYAQSGSVDDGALTAGRLSPSSRNGIRAQFKRLMIAGAEATYRNTQANVYGNGFRGDVPG